MKNPELFHKTVGILVKAYFNGTLLHTNCHACAVGNLVAGNMGYSYKVNPTETIDYPLIWTHCDNYEIENNWFRPVVFKHEATKNALIEIKSTGYALNQLGVIEDAFEYTNTNDDDDNDGYKGVMAVVDALIKIHKGSHIEAQTAKELFTLTRRLIRVILQR